MGGVPFQVIHGWTTAVTTFRKKGRDNCVRLRTKKVIYVFLLGKEKVQITPFNISQNLDKVQFTS
jgi:hypothetical protein